MKIFISWSGELSKQLGEAIKDWIPSVIQSVDPYFTPSDIDKGSRWSVDIANELESSKVGIICLTKDNLESGWVLFEAGALSRQLEKSYVCPILFGITNTDVSGPLKQFQTTEFEKHDMLKLLNTINQLTDAKLPQKNLETTFEKWWPDLNARIESILSQEDKPQKPIRNDRDILEEILTLNRSMISRMTRPSQASPDTIKELIIGYINIHDEQSDETGGYQETLDSLKILKNPINNILSRYAGTSPDIDKLIDKFNNLTYKISKGKASIEDEDDLPF
ncbi:MAG: toll/interleukin-1 receptor domain-containing protein [Acidithiobacillus ferrivorans]